MLRRDVEAALEWDPRVDAREIGVAAKDGVVTLSGHVSTYSERVGAEEVTTKVKGVRGIANEVEVKLGKEGQRSDTEIAAAAVTALGRHVAVPSEGVRVVVRDGWITLEGSVDAMYRRIAAENAVRFLPGVRGINDLISIRPRVAAADVKTRIEAAFYRHAHLDATHITVLASDGSVTLSGTVPTWHERKEAENAAWAAPGVLKVSNQIVVRA
jgi:osmotically-inducible protein OsmY